MKFILASNSERRIRYLKDFGYTFEVKKVNYNELFFENDPIKTAIYNAYMKAYLISKDGEKLPVLGVDTLVALDGLIFGKPKDIEDNVRMLKKFLGKEHLVISGVACVKVNVSIVDYEITKVKFTDTVADEIIFRYVKTNEGLDKAGGYAIQGLGSIFVSEVIGPISNVIGMPILKIEKILNKISEVKNESIF